MSRIVLVDTGTMQLTVPAIPLFIPEKATAVVGEIQRDYTLLALQYLAGVVSEKAPRYFGTLGQSFQAYPSGSTGGIEMITGGGGAEIIGRVFSSLPYAIVMEEGRRAGAPMPPIAPIELWVRRKLGISGDEATGVAYAIALTISRRGIRGRHYAREGFQQAEPRIVQIFDEMGKGIRDALAGEGAA